MVANLLYVIAGLLAAPAMSYLLLGEYWTGLGVMIVLMFIYGGGWVMSWFSHSVDTRPTWKPPKRKPWARPGVILVMPLPTRHVMIEPPQQEES
jgi:hypothetical protein